VSRCPGVGACVTAIVVCSHLPDEGHFRSERFPVAPVVCREHEPLDYWAGLNRFWRSDVTIVNVEHDVEATDEHVQALLDCPEPLCSHAYRCHWISTGLPGGVIAAGMGARVADTTMPPEAYYLQGGEEWANWSAIGLVKVTAAARVGPLRPEPWQRLELALHDAVTPPFHMHGNGTAPGDFSGHIPHHHW
jgi:hypothetical protein